MRDYSCHTISFTINAFEKSVNFPFNYIICVAVVDYVVADASASSFSHNKHLPTE